MSAVVIVTGPNLRKVNIKVTPGTTLNDVLSQACDRFGLSAESFCLKHGKNTVDLTLPFRLSRLSPGAKLDLSKREASKSNAQISVALQFIDGSLPRLVEKFSSSTTLWEILKEFEKTRTGNGRLNLTERARPDGTTQGAGRLYYEMPVIQIMNRELSSFDDLKKTLSSLGFTSGTALLRIKFTETTIPLEEALVQIGDLSKSAEHVASEASSSSAVPAPDQEMEVDQEPPVEPVPNIPTSATESEIIPTIDNTSMSETTIIDTASEATTAVDNEIYTTAPAPHQTTTRINTSIGPSNRAMTVFNPNTSSAPPVAATLSTNEKDYEMNINQAKQYQAHLNAASWNKKLLTEDQKLAIAAEAQSKRLAVDQVDIRIRFPEGSIIQSVFTRDDKTKDLYSFVRGVLNTPGINFHIGMPGPKQPPIGDGEQKLIADLGITKPTILNFWWGEDVGEKIRKQDPLSKEYREMAKKMEVPKEAEAVDDVEDDKANKRKGTTFGNFFGGGSGSGKSVGGGGSSSGGKAPKWFNLGKKK